MMRASPLLVASLAVLVAAGAAHAEVIYTERSLYRNIMVSDEGDDVCLSFRLQDGAVNSLQSCMHKSDHDKLVFDYTRMVMGGLFLQPAPKRVLIAGLGGGSIPRALAKLLPDAQIDVVEIDPAIVSVAGRFFDFHESDRVRVIVKDARVYVKQAARLGARYDMIVLDAFNGDYIPEHLMTEEFLRECASIMTPGAVLVANTFSSSRLYDSESVTYREALGPFLNLRQREGNRIIVARPGRAPTVAEFRAGAAGWRAKLAHFGADVETLIHAASDGVDWDTHARPLTDQYNPANLLQGPRR